MRFRRPLFALMAVLVAGASLALARYLLTPPIDRSAPVPLDALDACVQIRFQSVNKDFGYGRVESPAAHLRSRFEAVTPQEKRPSERLPRRGLDGRNLPRGADLAAPGIGMRRDGRRSTGSYPVRGPVYLDPRRSLVDVITGARKFEKFPESTALWEEGRLAMDAFATSDRRESTLGSWTISARAVRANRKECLDCHSHGYVAKEREGEAHNARMPDLKLGDPIGVLFYVYKRRN